VLLLLPAMIAWQLGTPDARRFHGYCLVSDRRIRSYDYHGLRLLLRHSHRVLGRHHTVPSRSGDLFTIKCRQFWHAVRQSRRRIAPNDAVRVFTPHRWPEPPMTNGFHALHRFPPAPSRPAYVEAAFFDEASQCVAAAQAEFTPCGFEFSLMALET
jgi:hypothetical protein